MKRALMARRHEDPAMQTRRSAALPHPAVQVSRVALLAAFSVACLLGAAPLEPHAQPLDPGAQHQRIDDLKRQYLSCSGAATRGRLSSGQIMQCSVIYETLKQQAFNGDFYQLLAWSRSQRLRQDTQPDDVVAARPRGGVSNRRP
jgi:hypothetical protein